MHVMPAQAGIQCLKSLDYEIHPCISSCGPAIGCSNLLHADLVRLKTCRNDEFNDNMIFNRHYLFIQYRRVGFAHRFRGVYAFVLVGGAHPTKHMPEPSGYDAGCLHPQA